MPIGIIYMSIIVDKNKKNSDKSHFSGEAVSEAVFDAFDKVEKDNVGKLCLDARLKKGLTQEQASKTLKVKVSTKIGRASCRERV